MGRAAQVVEIRERVEEIPVPKDVAVDPPLRLRIESVDGEANLEEVCNTERHRLYVACTRVRARLFVSGVEPVSEFFDDLIDTRQARGRE